MRKITPYGANGRPKTCWGCGNPFIIRNGHSEAIVGLDGRFYCYGNACGDDALASIIPLDRPLGSATIMGLRVGA
jgi:hypothetical protein